MTTTINEADEPCQTCGQPRSKHTAQMRHPFNDGSLPFEATFGRGRTRPGDSSSLRGDEGPQRPDPLAGMPFDPVLRQALIDKGVLTPEDLRNAEATIRAVTAQFHQQMGSGSNGELTGR